MEHEMESSDPQGKTIRINLKTQLKKTPQQFLAMGLNKFNTKLYYSRMMAFVAIVAPDLSIN